MRKGFEPVIDELFPEEMATYLNRRIHAGGAEVEELAALYPHSYRYSVDEITLGKMIPLAPVSIQKKHMMYRDLAEVNDSTFFSEIADSVYGTMQNLPPETDDAILVVDACEAGRWHWGPVIESRPVKRWEDIPKFLPKGEDDSKEALYW